MNGKCKESALKEIIVRSQTQHPIISSVLFKLDKQITEPGHLKQQAVNLVCWGNEMKWGNEMSWKIPQDL